MRKLWKHLKESKLTLDYIIVCLGLVLITFLVLTLLNPKNSLYVVFAFATAGLINILNGMKIGKDKKRRNMGLTYILFGVVLFIIGCIAMLY